MSRWVVLAALVGGCGGGAKEGSTAGTSRTEVRLDLQAKGVETPLATVNGARIGEETLRHLADRSRPADGAAHTPEERAALIDDMVTEEVLFQKAIAEGLYHDQKVRKILTNLLLRQQVYGKVSNADFTEDELRAYYEAHKDQFVVPEKVQAKRVLIRITGDDEAAAKARADALYTQLKADPTAFATVATASSEGPYKRRGGDLGFVAREGKPGVEPEVVERAFEAPLDKVLEPFRAGDAFHILLVVNKRDRVERTFEQMRGSVLRMVKQERFETLRQQFIDQVKADTTIELHQEAIDAVDLSKRGRLGGRTVVAPGGEKHRHGGHDHGKDADHDHGEGAGHDH
jgi:hypothetical protein